MNNLFSEQAAYTIDLSSLLKLFKESEAYYKGNFPSLWNKIEEAILEGEIISHIQVYDEIMQFNGDKDELMIWAKENKHLFRDYNLPEESDFIRIIGEKYPQFLSQGKHTIAHADPWLVAQARHQKLTVICDEGKTKHNSLHVVCREYKIPSLDILGLMKQKQRVV
ncbi:MAG: DUF4411 family protein [Candidatus Peregrinibacteria bacterium]|nr:DUF4411 family protein [Candidatus Peregrinibacteria bacterium]